MFYKIFYLCSGNSQQNKYFFFKKIRTYLEKLFLINVIIIIIIGGLFIVKWMNNVSSLKFFKLDITGYLNYNTKSDIHKVIASICKTKCNFMSKNINFIRNKLEQLPLINHVNVRKKWPNKIYVNIVEDIPIVSWNKKYMLNINGNVLKVPSNYIYNISMPMLYGPQNSEKIVLEVYHDIHKILKLGYFHLKSVLMTNRKSWQIVITHNNLRLYLGDNDIINRIKMFVKIYPELLKIYKDKETITYIDLRYNYGLALGFLSTMNKFAKTNPTQN